MKKGVIALIIILFLLVIGLVSFIIVDKLVLSDDDDESGSSKKVATNEVNNNVGTNENDGDKIYAEIVKKEFLTNNGIKEEDISIFKYCFVETSEGYVYFVLISYLEDEQPEHGMIFQVTYKNGKVSFDKIEDHKYLSDTVSFDSKKEILKLSATYHGGTRNNYFKLKDGKFEEIDLAVKEGSKDYNFEELKLYDLEYNKGTTTSKMTESEALETAKSTYQKAYYVVNGMEGETDKIFVWGDYSVNGQISNYKVDVNVLKKYFTENAITKILSMSHFTQYNGEYYVVGNYVDFISGIFGLTDQGLRPLKVTSYTDSKISATGQLVNSEYDVDTNPLKIEFVKSGDKWLIDSFE